MLQFISSQLLFYVAIILVLFVPGYFFLLAIESRKKLFSSIEKLVFSFGFSIIITNFLMIILGKAGIILNKTSVILGIVIFSTICLAIYKITKRDDVLKPENIFNFSKNQKIIIIILLFLTIFIKTTYLRNSIFPTSTDLGHHMYWSKIISENGKIPIYQESDIIETNGNYQISQPQQIADFIIGEHLVFSAINMISEIKFISYFPSTVLFLVNIFVVLTIFVLTLRFFENYHFGKNIAIISLVFCGPLYAISSSQAKFVSGGVIGNTIGNLLIPFCIYFLFRALNEKNSKLFSLFLLSLLGLAYTHHLSTFIFVFVFVFTVIIFNLFNLKNILPQLKNWMKMVFRPGIIFIIFLILFFIFFVYTPTYLNTEAVGTAVGGPSKETRAGLTFNQIKTTAGEARMVFGIIGIIILLSIKKRKNYESAFVLGWGISIFLMTIKPHWLFLDLPSSRIANYISFPFMILGSFALAYIFDKLKNGGKKYFLSSKTLIAFCFMLITFILTSGFYDNSQSLNIQGNYGKAIETFKASEHLSLKTNRDDIILKDHNYLVADAWIKLYFMRDYSFPFSRGYFKRYEDSTKPREMCTLWMISEPNTKRGQKCFNDLRVNFIMVNPRFDSAQFEKSQEFWKIYSGKEINIYYRPNNF